MTFSDHINRLRIDEACRLLTATDDSISAIAYSVGFTSVPYFNRIFRQLRDCTPSDYAKR